jgi:hypothetical protein
MLGFKFRILHSEVEDFYRDILVPSECTFEDFHNCIIESIGFDGNELSSFFLTDKDWNKKGEITCMDMMLDDDGGSSLTMKDAIIGNYIDEPHQRLLYEYDFLNVETFYVELVDTEDIKTCHPEVSCIDRKGEIEKSEGEDPLMDAEVLAALNIGSDTDDGDEIGDMFKDLSEDDVYDDGSY